MTPLDRCWHPVAWSHEVGRKPLGVRVLDRRVVAFRSPGGAAAVLEDRCAHRGVLLSGGQVDGASIVCPYHGWAFDASGRCAHIPSLRPTQSVPPGIGVTAFPVRESGGLVWFCFSPDPIFPDPPGWHHAEDPHFFTATIDIRAGYARVMENVCDNSHAGFLHAGLLRTKPSSPVVAHIRQTAGGVFINTVGERARDSILSRLFGKNGQEFVHTEAYEHPYVIKTFFEREPGRHISSQFLCVPVDQHSTRWFCRLTLTFASAPLIMPIFRRIILKILNQDRHILEERELRLTAGDAGKSVSTAADAPGLLVLKSANEFAARGVPVDFVDKDSTVEYLL